MYKPSLKLRFSTISRDDRGGILKNWIKKYRTKTKTDSQSRDSGSRPLLSKCSSSCSSCLYR